MHLPCTDLENHVFDIFRNCRHRMKFAAVFRVKEGGY